MMIGVVVAARQEQRSGWLSGIEAELASAREISIAARVSTSSAAITAAREQALAGRPVVVVCCQQLDEGDAVDVAQACRDFGVAVITLVDESDAPPVEALLNIARTPFVFQPGPPRNLLGAIHELALATPPYDAAGRRLPQVNGRLVVLASADSAGKTMLAGAISVQLARRLGTDSVALLELTTQPGSAEVLLGLSGPADHRLEGLLTAVGELKPDDLRRAAVLTPAGCRLIPGPSELEHAALLQPTSVNDLLKKLRLTFPVTVIDTSSQFDDVLVTALLAADLVVWATTLRLVAVRHLLQVARTAERLGVSRERMGVVVNGAPRKPSSTQRRLHAELVAAFPHHMFDGVPLDPAPWPDWIERGDPQPRVDTSACAPAFANLATHVARRISAPDSAPTRPHAEPGAYRTPRWGSIANLRHLFRRAEASA